MVLLSSTKAGTSGRTAKPGGLFSYAGESQEFRLPFVMQFFARRKKVSNFLRYYCQLEIFYDGKQFPIEPGQTVIPHGPDRELTVDEALPRKIKPDIYQAT
jgi:hypothetical protein